MDTTTGIIGPRVTGLFRALAIILAPASAAVYLVLWIFAETGRIGLPQKVETFALFAVAIGLARWMPFTALGLVVVLPALQWFGLVPPPDETTWPSYEAGAMVVFLVAFFARGLVRWIALGCTVVVAAVDAVVMAFPTASRPYVWGSWIGDSSRPRHDAAGLGLAALGILLGSWVVGFALSRLVSSIVTSLESTEATLEETGLELRLEQDRARISRDVHDSLAHSLAVVVSQAQGATALSSTRPEVAGEALETIAEVARTALVDVRMLVERIQNDGDATAPARAVADVPELVETMRSLGMTVDLRVGGTPLALTDSQQVAVYRIVQESLTNALKHSGARSRVTVGLQGESAGLALEVASEGQEPLVEGHGRGVGIEGMKERARLAGGWLRAAPTGGLGASRFIVTAFVPATRSLLAGAVDA